MTGAASRNNLSRAMLCRLRRTVHCVEVVCHEHVGSVMGCLRQQRQLTCFSSCCHVKFRIFTDWTRSLLAKYCNFLFAVRKEAVYTPRMRNSKRAERRLLCIQESQYVTSTHSSVFGIVEYQPVVLLASTCFGWLKHSSSHHSYVHTCACVYGTDMLKQCASLLYTKWQTSW